VTPQGYDTCYATQRGRWIGNTEFDLLWRELDPEPRASLLDVGCGTGWFTRRFAAAGLNTTGLDVDPAALAYARAQSVRTISDVEGDARDLPFPDRSFDYVASIAALCFVEEWLHAIAEIARVSRHRFVLGLLNRHSLLWRDKGRRGGKGAYHGAHWHTRRELDAIPNDLPIERIGFGSAIFLPSETMFARSIERVVPQRLLGGPSWSRRQRARCRRTRDRREHRAVAPVAGVLLIYRTCKPRQSRAEWS
jgi:SAM-dependent methyltransferase